MGVIKLKACTLHPNSKILNINGGLLNPSHILLYDEDRRIQSCKVQPTWVGRKRIIKTKLDKHKNAL